MKDGGPAFPMFFDGTPNKSVLDGISVRDYFAAAALQGILAAGSHWTNIARSEGASGVKLAYGYADDMLKEREKQP